MYTARPWLVSLYVDCPQNFTLSNITLKVSCFYGYYVERFMYTAHPWLVSLYVECPQNFTLSNITLKVAKCKVLRTVYV
jgi:hypothetical protein